MIENNTHENRTLAEFGDTLPPSTMSGEIQTRDAEGQVETVP